MKKGLVMTKLYAAAFIAAASLGLVACGEKAVEEPSNAEFAVNETMDDVGNEALEAVPATNSTTANQMSDPAVDAADAAKDAASAAAEPERRADECDGIRLARGLLVMGERTREWQSR